MDSFCFSFNLLILYFCHCSLFLLHPSSLSSLFIFILSLSYPSTFTPSLRHSLLLVLPSSLHHFSFLPAFLPSLRLFLISQSHVFLLCLHSFCHLSIISPFSTYDHYCSLIIPHPCYLFNHPFVFILYFSIFFFFCFHLSIYLSIFNTSLPFFTPFTSSTPSEGNNWWTAGTQRHTHTHTP